MSVEQPAPFAAPAAPRALSVARATLAVSVATAAAICGWIWGNLSWKATGSPSNALGLSLLLFVLLFTLGWSSMGRKLSWRTGCAVMALAVGLPTCGSCVTALNDFNPGGGTNFMFANNTPHNASEGLGGLLLGGVLIGLSARWPLRRAARADDAAQAPGLCVLAGTWLLVVLTVVWALCRAVPVLVERWLIPYAGLGVLSLVLGLALAKPRLRSRCSALALLVVVTTFGLCLLESRSLAARCERAAPGLVLSLRLEKSFEYVAPGVELERLVCKQTFQYSDEDTRLVYGKLANGSELQGASLFARVQGTPLSRARAARELLLADDCHELISPDTASDYVPAYEIQAPLERGGKLVFHCLHHNYIYGRGTSVGMQNEPTRYVVDLRTLTTTWERLR